MTTFLFWNVNGRDLSQLLADIVGIEQVDVLILAEFHGQPAQLLHELHRHDDGFAFHYTTNNRLAIFSNHPQESIVPLRDSNEGLSIRRFIPPVGEEILLIAVHLRSKMRLSDDDQGELCNRLRVEIEDAESQVGHRRTVVVGDLNMNPFERGMISAEGLHAVATRRRAMQESRKVLGADRFFFYNPMWGSLGDRTSAAAGTFHYSASRPIEYFWHMFDQVLIRPELLKAFSNEQLRIVTRVGDRSLLASDGTPDVRIGSDHLPITFQLNLVQAAK